MPEDKTGVIDDLARITNRFVLAEASLAYYIVKLEELRAYYSILGQQNLDLRARVGGLESEVRALRECLSIREMGPQGVVPMGPEGR